MEKYLNHILVYNSKNYNLLPIFNYLNISIASMKILESVEVEYKTFSGWNTSISECRNFESLPENAKIYCKFIEDFLNVPSNILLSCY
jgi:adenylosuccinate synthase